MAGEDTTRTTRTGSGPARTGARPSGTDQVRLRAAQAIRTVLTLAALFLAVGALLVAVRNNINETNPIVRFITDVADAIDGPFSRDSGIFTFSGKNGVTKEALVNWGIAALVYLLIGRVLDRLIRR